MSKPYHPADIKSETIQQSAALMAKMGSQLKDAGLMTKAAMADSFTESRHVLKNYSAKFAELLAALSEGTQFWFSARLYVSALVSKATPEELKVNTNAVINHLSKLTAEQYAPVGLTYQPETALYLYGMGYLLVYLAIANPSNFAPWFEGAKRGLDYQRKFYDQVKPEGGEKPSYAGILWCYDMLLLATAVHKDKRSFQGLLNELSTLKIPTVKPANGKSPNLFLFANSSSGFLKKIQLRCENLLPGDSPIWLVRNLYHSALFLGDQVLANALLEVLQKHYKKYENNPDGDSVDYLMGSATELFFKMLPSLKQQFAQEAVATPTPPVAVSRL